MEQERVTQAGAVQLTERRAQQRAAVLAVIGAEPVADVAPDPAPPTDAPPEPVAPAAPAIPATPVETDVGAQNFAPLPPPVTPPVEPPRPAPKLYRHFLSRFVHRRMVKTRSPLAPVATHPVSAHRRHPLRWILAAAAVVAVTPVATWIAIYRIGADGPAMRIVAAAVPLRAGRIGSKQLLLSDLYSRVAWQPRVNASPLAAIAPVAEGDKAAAFRSWVDEQLIRAELVRAGHAVTAEQLSRELDRIQRGIGERVDLASWASATYGLTVPEFREAILRPAVERARLGVVLIADRQRYGQAWQQAEAASRVRGLVGMADQGWVDALDIGPAAADAIAATSRDTRTAPVPTPDGLAVYRFSESATDDDGATHWHLWKLLFPAAAADDFLAQARPAADAAYYLP